MDMTLSKLREMVDREACCPAVRGVGKIRTWLSDWTTTSKGAELLGYRNMTIYLPLEGNSEKEMATHSSTLAWKIPWTEEPGRLQSMGSQRVRNDWATSLSLYICLRVSVWSTWVLIIRIINEPNLHAYIWISYVNILYSIYWLVSFSHLLDTIHGIALVWEGFTICVLILEIAIVFLINSNFMSSIVCKEPENIF